MAIAIIAVLYQKLPDAIQKVYSQSAHAYLATPGRLLMITLLLAKYHKRPTSTGARLS